MLGLLKTCFPDQIAAWEPRLAALIPSYGTSLNLDPALARASVTRTAEVLAISA
jgi:malate dehydrogenase (quinone)